MADVKNTLSLELQVKYDQAMKALGEVRGAIAAVTQGTPSTATGGDLGGMQRALGELKTSIAEVKTAMASVGQGSGGGGLASGIGAQAAKAKAELNDLKNSITGVGDAASGAAGGGLRSMATGLVGLGVGVFTLKQIADAVIDVGRALLEAQGRLDNFRAGIQFALGRDAGADLDYVRETASNLGLELTSLSRSYVQFMAASRGTSLEGTRAREVFESIAQASSVLGLSAERQEGALRALAQMMSKGTVQAEELRGQLGDQLPGAFRLAAQAMGVTEGQLSKMLERGEVIASDFLPKFAAALRTQLGDTAVTAADGAQQAMNRLASAWERFVQAVADSGVGQVLKGALNTLSEALSEVSEAFERAKRSGDGFFSTLAKGYAAYAGYVLRGFEKETEALEASIRKNEELLQRQVRNGYDPKGGTVSAIRSQIERDKAELEWLRGSGDDGGWMNAGQRKAMDEQREQAERRRRLEADIGDEITKNLSQIAKAEKALADFRSKYALLQGTAEYDKLEKDLVRKLAEARDTASRKGVAQPIPSARRVFDTEVELALDAARREERALQESYGVRLTDLQTYLDRRRQIADAALSAETARQQTQIDAQRELLRKLDAITPKTDVQAQTIADRRTDAQRTIEQAQAQQIKAQRDRDDIERQLRLFETTERLAEMERTRTRVAEGYREVQDRIRLAVERREITERQAQDYLAEANRRTAEGLRAQAEQYDRIAEAGGIFAENAARAAAALRVEADKLDSTLTFIEQRFRRTADSIDAAFQEGLADIFESIGEKGTKAADVIREAFLNVGRSIRRSLAEIAAEDTLNAINQSLGKDANGQQNTLGRVISRALGVDGSSRERALWVRNADGAGAAAAGAQGILPGDLKGTPGIGDVLGNIGTQLRDLFGGWMDTLGQLFGEITGGFGSLFDGLLSSLGSIFSSGGGGGGGGFFDAIGSFFGSFFHQGGVVGAGMSRGRMVDPRVWIGAPRFHNGGIAGNEVAAILKRGEEVLTEDDPRHAKNGGAAMGVKVELINQGTPQRATGSQARFDGRQMVVQVFTEDMAENGPMSRAIQDTLGGNRAAGLS
ncbi:tape measure protein [Methyloversatilis discipulorum]|uniref:tape measure protein n=1 Tax=Methyloversatilis discipulorum TaxID=1119528 RepID=UPI00036882CC|nr:tape measure protein [Methyloversatilis discipulorum]